MTKQNYNFSNSNNLGNQNLQTNSFQNPKNNFNFKQINFMNNSDNSQNQDSKLPKEQENKQPNQTKADQELVNPQNSTSDKSNKQDSPKDKPKFKIEFDKNNSSNLGGENKPPKNSFNRQIWLNIASVIAMLVILGVFFGSNKVEEKSKSQNSFSGLITLIRQGKISEIELGENKNKLNVKIYEGENKNRDKTKTEVFPMVDSGLGSPLDTIKTAIGNDSNVKIGTSDGEIIYKQKEAGWYAVFEQGWFQTFFLLAVTGIMALFLVRKLTDANNRSISFGNSRSKLYDEDTKNKVTFADVAGNKEAKQELEEIVDFLQRPEEYTKMGAKIPKGVLLIGSPGNGKTLMAKAIAGEAKVPFMYVSGSEFVEMFVGVGASRVRDLFKQAKKKGRCVIFIDEIDAVGRQRGAGLGGGNDEREQTLNQILVELDGFESTDYIILVGATNRPDVLDPALLRPGRFDRQVTVTSPDRKERESILKIHAKNKKFAQDVDLSIIAKRTAGFSGADLMNVLNESAIFAVREKSEFITNTHIREGVEKAILGPSLASKVITDEQKKLTAYHEAGHAIIQTILPECNKVQKITIIPRGRAAGYTFAVDGENDAITKKKSEFLATITSLFGGYVTEEIIFGEVSTGGSNDLEKATEIARNMATIYGMSNLGPISFEKGKGLSFLGKDMMDKPSYSEDSARKIDLEVAAILTKCYKDCQNILAQNIVDLHRLAQFLIEKEVIEYEELQEIIGHLLPKNLQKKV